MTAGVYAITNASNGKVYVGSSVNIERRWQGRRYALARGKDANRTLQRDWESVSGQGFSFAVLEVIEPDDVALETAEDRWMASLRESGVDLYNVRTAYVGRRGGVRQPRRLRSGWFWPDGSRKAHYFDNSDGSLCGRMLLTAIPLNLEDANHRSPDNCIPCMDRRSRRAEEGTP